MTEHSTEYIITWEELEEFSHYFKGHTNPIVNNRAKEIITAISSRPLSEHDERIRKEERSITTDWVTNAIKSGQQCPYVPSIDDNMTCADCWRDWVNFIRSGKEHP